MNIDPNESPDGYYAVLKISVKKNNANICRECDWRMICQQPNTDFTSHKNRCMSDSVFVGNTEVYRKDGCSVVFKRGAV